MLMSTNRILVSHVGSLPRAARLTDLLIRQEAGETIDTAELAREVETATAYAIGKQVEAGVDVGTMANKRASDFRPMCRGAYVASAVSPNVRRRGTSSNSPAMSGRPPCVFRTRRAQ